MKLLKITLSLLLIVITAGLNAQVSRQCRDFTPVFKSANVNGCELSANVNDAQGQGPENFSYIWTIDGQVVSPISPTIPYRLSYSFDEAGSHTVTVLMTLNRNRRCRNSVSFTFNIDEACEGTDGIGIGIDDVDVDGEGDGDTTYPCPTNNDIHFNYEGGGGLCTDGSANITGLATSHVDRVEWTWALGGSTGVGDSTGTTSPIDFGSGDFTGSEIVVRATVFYDNGQECDRVWKRFPLNCGQGFRNSIEKESEIQLYPNPTSDFFTVKLPDNFKVDNISIRRFDGVEMKKIKKFKEKISVSDLAKGTYFVEFIAQNKKAIVKKLVIQ